MLFILTTIFIVKSDSTHRTLPNKYISINNNQDVTVLNLNNAIGASLKSNSSNQFCILKPPHLNSKNYFVDFIDNTIDIDDDIRDISYFTAFAHIRDGLIIMNSDSILSLFKFNYNNFGIDLPNQGKGSEFGSYLWYANFSTFYPYPEAWQEFPQLIYSNKTNKLFFIFQNAAQWVEMEQLDAVQTSVSIQQSGQFIQRFVRRYTLEYNGFIFTCVADKGLDIYLIEKNDLKILQNLFGEDQELSYVIEDIEVQVIDGYYYFYILLNKDSILIVQLYYQDIFKIKSYKQINFKHGNGIALVAKNQTLVIASKLGQKYTITEYKIIDQTIKQIRSITQLYSIEDLQICDDYAIVIGANKYQIFYLNKNENYQFDMPIYKMIGIMQLTFFRYSNLKISNEEMNKLDNTIIGMTARNLFLSTYEERFTEIQCYPQNFITFDQYYLYEINYTEFNTTIIENSLSLYIKINEPTQYELLFLILFVSLSSLVLIIIIGFICYKKYSKIAEIVQKDIQVAEMKRQITQEKVGVNTQNLSNIALKQQ